MAYWKTLTGLELSTILEPYVDSSLKQIQAPRN